MTTDASPVDERRLREVLGCFASGVTVVTAMDEEPVGFTCQAFTALSLDPPLVALAPAKSSTSWPRMRDAGAFCVNVLARGQESLCRSFSISGADKFRDVAWRSGVTGAPILDGSLAYVDCELEFIHDAGDHELVIGRVVDLDSSDVEPLIFFRSAFGTIQP